jgi:hypothetical protein
MRERYVHRQLTALRSWSNILTVLPNIDAYFAATGSQSKAVRPIVCDQTGVAGGVQGNGATQLGQAPGTPQAAFAAAQSLAAGTGNGVVQNGAATQGQAGAAAGAAGGADATAAGANAAAASANAAAGGANAAAGGADATGKSITLNLTSQQIIYLYFLSAAGAANAAAPAQAKGKGKGKGRGGAK